MKKRHMMEQIRGMENHLATLEQRIQALESDNKITQPEEGESITVKNVLGLILRQSELKIKHTPEQFELVQVEREEN